MHSLCSVIEIKIGEDKMCGVHVCLRDLIIVVLDDSCVGGISKSM